MRLKGEKVAVCGAGGFIGGHLVKYLRTQGIDVVRAIDVKPLNEWYQVSTDVENLVVDLKDKDSCYKAAKGVKGIFQLAADMGGAGYIFTGEHDADVMHNSATINLNVIDACYKRRVGRVFYSSSACMYPAYNQEDPANPLCSEGSAYPAAPDS